MMNNTYAIGDVHGNHKGLVQALERTPLVEGDTLIFLGDLVDGHSQSYEVIEKIIELRKNYNVVLIKGNHDVVFHDWINSGVNGWDWRQGQLATAESYMSHCGIENGVTKRMDGYSVKLNPGDIPDTHQQIYNSQINYYIDDENNLFIHGGFNRHLLLKEQEEYVFYRDRDLWSQALSYRAIVDNESLSKPSFKMKQGFKTVFIGHTSTEFWGQDTPMKAANIINLDTGGGWYGRITVFDVHTEEYYQSDRAELLYPEFKGRS